MRSNWITRDQSRTRAYQKWEEERSRDWVIVIYVRHTNYWVLGREVNTARLPHLMPKYWPNAPYEIAVTCRRPAAYRLYEIPWKVNAL